MNLKDLIENEIKNGYGDADAQAKVCQDIILKAISKSSVVQNVTIKGGVVLRSKSGSVRRATQDIDIDFIKYSINNEAIDEFISKLNCIEGLIINRTGAIEELKQQDYQGKRVLIELSDKHGNKIVSKIDLGVHTHFDIKQEEYCFDIALDDKGASVLINTNEQIFVEKLRSLLRFGSISTRYKDIYDMYFLCKYIDKEKLYFCIESCIFNDSLMREKDIKDIIKRMEIIFSDEKYLKRIANPKNKWTEEDILDVIAGIKDVLVSIDK